MKDDTAHLTPVEPPAALAKLAVVPATTEAFSTSPTATLAPAVPAAPVVSTAAGSSARAGEATSASARAATAAIGAVLDARMGCSSFSRTGRTRRDSCGGRQWAVPGD